MKYEIIGFLCVILFFGGMLIVCGIDSNNKQEYVKPKLAEYCKPLIECEDK